MSFEIARAFVTVTPQLDEGGISDLGSELEEGLGGAAESTSQRVGAAASNIGGTLTKGVTAPILGVAAAGVGMAKSFANSADDIDKNSQRVGVSTDAYQEWMFVAEQTGMSHDQMDRGLQRVNERLGDAADGSGKYAEAWQGLGVATHDANGNLRDADDVLMDTIAALNEIEDPAARATAAADVLGKNLGPKMAPLINEGVDGVSGLRQQIHDLGGVMSEESVAAGAEFNDTLNEVQRALGGAFAEIASAFLPILQELTPVLTDHVAPAIKTVADAIAGAINWFSDLPGPVQKVIGAIVGVAAAIGPVLVVIGKLIAVAGPVIAAIAKVGGVLALIANPIGIAVAAIGTLIAGLVYLYRNNEEFAAKVDAVWEWIKNIFQGAVEFIRGVIEGLVQFWQTHGETITNYLSATWDNIVQILQGAWEVIKGIWNTITGILTGDWEKAWEGIKQIFEGAWSIIEGLFNQVKNVISTIWAFIGDYLKETWNSIWDAITSKFEEWWGSMRGAWEAVKTFFIETWQSIKDGIVEKFNEIIEWFRALPERIKETVADIGTWLFQAGKDLIQGLIDGIKAAPGAVASAVGGVARSAVSSIGGVLGLSSPSRVFREIGQDTMLGFELGLLDKADDVANTMKSLGEITPVFASSVASPLASASVGARDGAQVVHNHLHGSVNVDPRSVHELVDLTDFFGSYGHRLRQQGVRPR